MKIKAAIYTRVSTDEQATEGYSLEVQEEYLEEFARRQGWEICYSEGKIYSDSMSGYSLERPALKRLLSDAKSKKFDIVLVYKIDRFSRKLKNLLNLVDELDQYDVALRSATEPYDTTTSAGKLMFQQLGSFAEFERNRIAERVFPGMVKGVQRGNWQGSRYVPYGYRYNREKQLLEAIPEEVSVVKHIYATYLSGRSTAQIAGDLYSQAHKTRSGGKFHSKFVCDILKNKLYLGKIVWNKHRYDTRQKTRKGYKSVRNDPSKVIEANGRHEAIISREDFDLVQKKLAANRRGAFHRSGSQDYPLTGLLYCASCNHKYRGANNIASHLTGAKKRWYRCTARQEHYIKCDNPSVRAEQIEPEVFAILDLLMSHPHLQKGRTENIVKYEEFLSDEDLKSRMMDLKARLKANHAEQRRLLHLYLKEKMSEEMLGDEVLDFRAEEQKIKKEMAKLDMMMIEKEKSEEYQSLLKRVIDQFDKTKKKLDIVAKKELLQLIFKRILTKNKEIFQVELNQPFQGYYEELKCQQKLKNTVSPIYTKGKGISYILKPTDAK